MDFEGEALRFLTKFYSNSKTGTMLWCLEVGFLALALTGTPVRAQPAVSVSTSVAQVNQVAIEGRVLDATGSTVVGATVRLEPAGQSSAKQTKTDGDGLFVFQAPRPGRYRLVAERAGLRSHSVSVDAERGEGKKVDLILEALKAEASTMPSDQGMEFADAPTFSVAGVTDWTAAGGHGSDTSLRVSEDLARATLLLKPRNDGSTGRKGTSEEQTSEEQLLALLARAPESFDTNRRLGIFYLHVGKFREALPLLQMAYKIDSANRENEFNLAVALKEAGDLSRAFEHVQRLLTGMETAELDSLAGEIDEQRGDPLAAVRAFEAAVRQEPSEQAYFQWGTELMLHRAILPAEQVFHTGATIYPRSSRLLSGWGAALFANARYEEAARRLCDASDLNPEDADPYLFMGKIVMVAPNPMPCVEEKLARFAQVHGGDPLAIYLYAMSLWKGSNSGQPQLKRVKELLEKAVRIDPGCADALLQLGNMAAAERKPDLAIEYYRKAIDANPQMDDAHYRLAVAYDRVGDSAKAGREFEIHEQIRKQQAATVEAQRRAVKQFVVDGQPIYPNSR